MASARNLRNVIAFLAVTAAIALSGPAAHAAEAMPAIPADSSSAAASQLVGFINSDRASNGLPPVNARADVASIAQSWSNQMASAQTLSHNDAFFSPSTHQSLGAQAEGENVGFSGSMEAVEIGFMNSPHHRENILDARFTDVGVGAVQDANGYWWVTEDFVQSTGAAAAPAPDPAPAADATPAPAAADPAPSAPSPAPAAPAPAPDTTPPATAPATAAAPAAVDDVALPVAAPAVSVAGNQPAGPPLGILLLGLGMVALDLLGLVTARARRATVRARG